VNCCRSFRLAGYFTVTFIFLTLFSQVNAEIIVLQNDSWDLGENAYYQQGFIEGEIMAAKFTAEEDQYPYQMRKVRVLVGDGGPGGAYGAFVLHIWEDNGGTTDPGDLLVYHDSYQLTAGYLNEIDLDPLMPPEIASGSVRVGLQFILDPPPSFYRDDDGIHLETNYIFAAGFGWRYSEFFGLTGDWILRLEIETGAPGPTETPAPPTNTPTMAPPTDTPIPPTDTPIPPTDTPIPPTDTPIPPTDTPTQPTATQGPPPDTPTITPVPTDTPPGAPTHTPTPPSTYSPAPTYTPVPTYTPAPTYTGLPTTTPHPTGSPVPTYTALPTYTQNPTFTPEPTFTQPPPSPTATDVDPSLELWMPSHYFPPGDPCAVNVNIHNTGDQINSARLVVMLVLNEGVWFWPSWRMGLDSQLMTVGSGDSMVVIIPEFSWPSAGSYSSIIFLAALTDPDYSELLADPDIWNWGFGE